MRRMAPTTEARSVASASTGRGPPAAATIRAKGARPGFRRTRASFAGGRVATRLSPVTCDPAKGSGLNSVRPRSVRMPAGRRTRMTRPPRRRFRALRTTRYSRASRRWTSASTAIDGESDRIIPAGFMRELGDDHHIVAGPSPVPSSGRQELALVGDVKSFDSLTNPAPWPLASELLYGVSAFSGRGRSDCRIEPLGRRRIEGFPW